MTAPLGSILRPDLAMAQYAYTFSCFQLCKILLETKVQMGGNKVGPKVFTEILILMLVCPLVIQNLLLKQKHSLDTL